MARVYVYNGCDSCRRAVKWLNARDVAPETAPIRETPPSREELESALLAAGGEMRKLFNVSGRDYREMDMKSRLPGMPESEAIALLSQNGNLVKRPFLATRAGCCAGFDEAVWATLLGLPPS